MAAFPGGGRDRHVTFQSQDDIPTDEGLEYRDFHEEWLTNHCDNEYNDDDAGRQTKKKKCLLLSTIATFLIVLIGIVIFVIKWYKFHPNVGDENAIGATSMVNDNIDTKGGFLGKGGLIDDKEFNDISIKRLQSLNLDSMNGSGSHRIGVDSKEATLAFEHFVQVEYEVMADNSPQKTSFPLTRRFHMTMYPKFPYLLDWVKSPRQLRTNDVILTIKFALMPSVSIRSGHIVSFHVPKAIRTTILKVMHHASGPTTWKQLTDTRQIEFQWLNEFPLTAGIEFEVVISSDGPFIDKNRIEVSRAASRSGHGRSTRLNRPSREPLIYSLDDFLSERDMGKASVTRRCLICGQRLTGKQYPVFSLGESRCRHYLFDQECLKCSRCEKSLEIVGHEHTDSIAGKLACAECLNKHEDKTQMNQWQMLEKREGLRPQDSLLFQWGSHEQQMKDIRSLWDIFPALRRSGKNPMDLGSEQSFGLSLKSGKLNLVKVSDSKFRINVPLFLEILAILCFQIEKRLPLQYAFSLDYVLDSYGKTPNNLQQAIYFPSVLEKTIGGEIMFQADYVLKKLSLGYIDIPEIKKFLNKSKMPLEARFWFECVTNSNMKQSKDGAFSPRFRMSVNVREITTEGGVKRDKNIQPSIRSQRISRFFTKMLPQIMKKYRDKDWCACLWHLKSFYAAHLLAYDLLANRGWREYDTSLLKAWYHHRELTSMKHAHVLPIFGLQKTVVTRSNRNSVAWEMRRVKGGVDMMPRGRIVQSKVSDRVVKESFGPLFGN